MLAGAARQRRVCMRFSCGHWPQCPGTLDSNSVITCGASLISSPHRLVVRTSRCGRDNPGSNPGVDTLVGWQCCPCLASCCVLPVRWLWARAHPVSTMPGIEVWCRGAGNTVRQRRSAWQGPAAPGRPPYRSTMPAGNYLLRFCCASSPHLLVVRTSRCGKQGAPTGHPCYCLTQKKNIEV